MPRILTRSFALPLVLLIAGACSAPTDGTADGTPRPTAVLSEVGGALSSSDPVTGPALGQSPATTPTPVPTPAPTATPAPTIAVTPPPQQDGFTAVVRACRSISGDQCNGELGTLPAGADRFTALVTFTAANGGDQISVTLTGPGGTIGGAPYTLQGGGNGYYYSIFQSANLPGGSYTLTASRNGAQVGATIFEIAGR